MGFGPFEKEMAVGETISLYAISKPDGKMGNMAAGVSTLCGQEPFSRNLCLECEGSRWAETE
jgi:hypothetical protein